MSDQNLIATDKQVEPQAGPARLIGTLSIFALISGLAIVGIYQATYATIARNKAKALHEAVFNVLPGVTQMQAYVWRDGHLVAEKGNASNDESVYAGYDAKGQFVGYAVPGSGPGFQDTIDLLYGYDPSRHEIVGMQVLESQETPGLGNKITKDQKFLVQFSHLVVVPTVILKRGNASKPNEIDGITGATISSRAVVRIINNTNKLWGQRLPQTPPHSG